MIDRNKALKIILKDTKTLGAEKIDLSSALHRVLVENIYSDVNLPPFHRSAMDGFAINLKDPSETFKIIEDIPAGKVPKKKIKFGQCARIMTGAMLPKGADKVVKVEDTEERANFMRLARKEKKRNVSPQGEDVSKGQMIIRKGTTIRPQETAMLASAGKSKIKVYRQPRVAIISTGSELVEVEQAPPLGKIRNSNSPMLLAQLDRLGIKGKYAGIAKDNFSFTRKLIQKALASSDMLIMSGGVSVGNYDFVRETLKSCGVRILFDRVAIKPGKPTVFGKKGQKLIFGLPGNPVSALVAFELFVVPTINKIVGRESISNFVRMPLLKPFQRRSDKREQYYPIKFSGGGVVPLKFHGSAHMQAFTLANGVMRLEKGRKIFPKGFEVDVRPI